jgi:hypothetical protein
MVRNCWEGVKVKGKKYPAIRLISQLPSLSTESRQPQMDKKFTFRMEKDGKSSYEDDQPGSEPSTAAPSYPSQSISAMASATSKSISAMASATSTDGSFQSSVSDIENVREAFNAHFSAMQSIAAKVSTTTTTEGGGDQAVTRQPMTLDEAERRLHAAGQVPLQGIEFLRYKARKPPLWCYRVYKRSSGELIGLQSWRSSPEHLVQDFKRECAPELVAEATCIWHHLEKKKEEDWKSSETFEEFEQEYFPGPIVYNKVEGSPEQRKRQRMCDDESDGEETT